MSHERRFLAAVRAPVTIETRADDQPAIVGYAAVFYRADDPGTEFRLWDNLFERIMPSAFDRAIKDGDDARGLFNHSSNFLLGRRTADTLRLSVDQVGLRYEIDPPDTQIGRDVMTSIKRGDLTGSSFAFFVRKASWIEEHDGEKLREIRQIEDVELIDVGPVTFPAYESTTTGLRSADGRAEVERDYRAWRESLERERQAAIEKVASDLESYRMRARFAAFK